MKIVIELKSVYGRETAYPACDVSRKFCDLTQRRTLTAADLRSIKALGYTIDIKDSRTQSQLMAAIGA